MQYRGYLAAQAHMNILVSILLLPKSKFSAPIINMGKSCYGYYNVTYKAV